MIVRGELMVELIRVTDHTDPAALLPSLLAHRRSEQLELTLAWWRQGTQDAQQRALPRTVPAGEQQRLSGGELEVEVHEHPATSVVTTQSLGSYR